MVSLPMPVSSVASLVELDLFSSFLRRFHSLNRVVPGEGGLNEAPLQGDSQDRLEAYLRHFLALYVRYVLEVNLCLPVHFRFLVERSLLYGRQDLLLDFRFFGTCYSR